MKIAILGGTGSLGRGLALRWCPNHQIVIGSRDPVKALRAAEEYRAEALKHYGDRREITVTGAHNLDAALGADAIVMTIPSGSIPDLCPALRERVKEGAIVISPINPISKKGGYFYYQHPQLPSPSPDAPGSSAQQIAQYLPRARVVLAFNSIPAPILSHLDEELDYDVFVAGDDDEAVEKVMELVREIPRLRPLKAGPLAVAPQLEALVALLLNLSRFSGLRAPSFKVLASKGEAEYGA